MNDPTPEEYAEAHERLKDQLAASLALIEQDEVADLAAWNRKQAEQP